MLSDKPQPFTPLHVLVFKDAEGAQVPFPPVEAYDEGQVPKAAPVSRVAVGSSDNWDLRNRVFEQTGQITTILIHDYSVTEPHWKRDTVAGGKLARAAEYMELARKELEA